MSDKNYTQKRIVKYGKRLRKLLNRTIASYSLVGNPPVFEEGVFAWTRDLETNWQIILAELQALMKSRKDIPTLLEISPDHKRLTDDGKWQSFFLCGYGYKSKANCRRCPQTAALIGKIPGLKTAMFSIHAPGIHIPRHKGVTKGMVVCHLGLIIPKAREKCRLKVDDQICLWECGKTFVFDDTYPHEVWNETDEDRVILLLQVERPLRGWGLILARIFMTAIRWSPFVQDARRKWQNKALPDNG
jgi:ornithine lipid ester-linked acyl 2-hydroxylase